MTNEAVPHGHGFASLFLWGSLILGITGQANESLGNEPVDFVRQGPQRINHHEVGVGRMVPDIEFDDLDGNHSKLSELANGGVTVIAMTGTGCPLCLKYTSSLAEIERQYRDRRVQFVYVNPNRSESRQRIRDSIETHKLGGAYVHDVEKRVVRTLDAKTTTEVFVLDSARTLIYRGAVDDQYGFGYSLDSPRQTYLLDALDSVLAGREPSTAATTSPGCDLFYQSDQTLPSQPVTYHGQVSRIIQSHCIECHRTDGIAPISLEDYTSVNDYAGMIRSVVERGTMPPWFAAETPGDSAKLDSSIPRETRSERNAEQTGRHLKWANDRTLPGLDRQRLLDWIDAGAPEGDPREAPLPRKFTEGWMIDRPDAVFGFENPVPIQATGVMPYQYVTVKTNLPEDKWVQAIEVRPSNVSVVHHVIVSIQNGDSDDGGQADETSGYWGVYVPGNSVIDYPDGFAKRLPKGATLRFQMHYTPNGTATEDQTEIGLQFADKPVKHEVKVAGIVNTRIRIPPGADRHAEFATLNVPHDVEILSFLPHMHVRGIAARFEWISSGRSETLLDIPKYDFNWQLQYRLAEPMSVQSGDKLKFTGWFDNSSKNPANPDPSKTVRWGDQTFDEMLLGYVEYFVPGAIPGDSSLPKLRRRPRNVSRQPGNPSPRINRALFARLDVNDDGMITRAEVRERMPNHSQAAGETFDRLDANSDDQISEVEFRRIRELGL